MMKRSLFVKGRLKNSRGFTLIEIIAALVILAIVSALVISRGMATDEAKLQAEVDMLKGHLRFAQYRAMNDLPSTLPTNQWGINLGGSSYTLVKDGATSTLNLPGESSATHNFSTPITASLTVNPNPILFDEWGSPGNANINIMFGGQTKIEIEANTGFIP